MNFKPTIKRTALPFLILGAGGVGLVLRVLLYTLGEDSHGLLPRYHALHILTLLLSLLLVGLLVPTVKHLDGPNRFRANFPVSVTGALSSFFAALWLLSVGFSILNRAAEVLDYVHGALAVAAVPCLTVTGWMRLKGRRPLVIFHGLICVFFALHMVCQYRLWSANPQIPDYIFHIFACACLTLTAYHRAAFDVGLGRRTAFLFFSLMAVYFCFLSLVGAGDGRFYFAGGIWAFGNLCPMDPPQRRSFSNTLRIPSQNERE